MISPSQHLIRFLSVLAIVLSTFLPCHTQVVLDNDTKVSLLTCDPGGELYSLFGHSAIWIYDEKSGINEVYNYGTFDYSDPNFLPKFLKGKLLYWLAKDDGRRFLYTYDYLKRGVRENEIVLDSIQKNHLYDALKKNALPENKDYYYDFFFDNCSTRILDILEDNYGPLEVPKTEEKSFRDLLHEYLGGREWTSFGIDLIIGSRADEVTSERQQMFLPDYLQSHLAQTTKPNGMHLMRDSKTIINHKVKQVNSFWITPMIVFIGILLLELFIIKRKKTSKWLRIYDWAWMVVMAICAVIMMFMWFGTNHQACGLNYNLLVFSPLIILWIIFKWIGKQSPLLKWISLGIILSYILIPFVKMSIQDLPPAVMIIALITAMKLFRIGDVKAFRKWV